MNFLLSMKCIGWVYLTGFRLISDLLINQCNLGKRFTLEVTLNSKKINSVSHLHWQAGISFRWFITITLKIFSENLPQGVCVWNDGLLYPYLWYPKEEDPNWFKSYSGGILCSPPKSASGMSWLALWGQVLMTLEESYWDPGKCPVSETSSLWHGPWCESCLPEGSPPKQSQKAWLIRQPVSFGKGQVYKWRFMDPAPKWVQSA